MSVTWVTVAPAVMTLEEGGELGLPSYLRRGQMPGRMD